MESMASSVFVSRFPETHPPLSPPSPSSSSSSACCYSSSSKILLSKGIMGSPKLVEAARFPRLRLQGLARELSGGAGEENSHLGDDGFGLVSDATLSLSQELRKQAESSQKDSEKILKVEPPLTVLHGSGTTGGTRAGLFRTPISGGVQSATSAHGLPRPALAVRNLMEQIPGWSSLSNARVTIFGDVYPLAEDEQEWAHKQYIAKHQQGPSQQWGNFYYFRMQNIRDIYFIGGFGTVAWVDVKEYEALQPDKIAVDGGEHNLKELNVIFSKRLKELLSSEMEVDDAAIISIDSKGIDIRVRQGAQFNVQRLSFEEGHAVENLEEAKSAVRKVLNKGKVQNLQK
ncbi:unnamed protein product [Linum tenue]|uniref:CREG-like beta-barrel domain-containing protein n=1 Tax=Linum tenue TaxID=586396 RepID=A0AAV0JNB8_9ROSI|nr:unnamed protein product [Linum tenue]